MLMESEVTWMQVLLIQDVPNLGQAGDIKRVADGYARNYLLAKGLAVPATKGTMKEAQQRQEALLRRQEKERNQAQVLAERISGLTLTFRARVGEKDRLYGSITTADIAEALSEKLGQEIDKRKIESAPLRELGTHQVPLRLTRDVSATVTVVIERLESEESHGQAG